LGKVEIEVSEVGGPIGSQTLMPELIVHNDSDLTVILQSAILSTGASQYSARPTEFEGEWGSIPPKGTGRPTLVWEFKQSIDKVLIEPVELRLRFKIGDGEKEFSIPMEQTFGRKR
jgi:hypothetical protein